jgi:uncharacterized membrane protein YozB (DUF420 family)
MQLVTGDYLLLIYIVLIVPLMIVGATFARQHKFVPHHKFTMTGLVIINWVFIIFVMVRTYGAAVAPNVGSGFTRAAVFIPTLHGLFGLAAQLLASYLVFRMWLENQLPEWIKVKNIKRYMRITLVIWFLTITLGILTWAVIDHGFLKPADAQGSTQPAATAEATEDATVVNGLATPAATAQATVATPAATAQATVATPAATAEVTTVATPAATAQATVSATKSP